MIYCYRRLNGLENGLIQQGRVMQEFITNYNLTMQMSDSTRLANGGGNNNINRDTVELQSREDKIVVSDDDLSDDDDDDDLSDDDDRDLREQINNIINDHDISDVGTDIEEIINNGSNKGRDIEVDSTHLTIDKLDIDLDTEFLQSAPIDALESAPIDALQPASMESLDLSAPIENDETDISSRIIPIVDIEGQDTSKKNPSRLKVDELRELVVNKNLVSNNEAQKLKKGELVRLLE
tara:strand:- start:17 stop:727 length:711 start_codon:yes stop_codon:yes gene_type:complete